MAVITNGTSKKCVTCQHFACERAPDMSKHYVRYESVSKGVCAKTKAAKAANQGGCPKWEKWSILK